MIIGYAAVAGTSASRRLGFHLVSPWNKLSGNVAVLIPCHCQWVKNTARGFRNKQNFIDAIYFHCGGLNLYPATHSNPR